MTQPAADRHLSWERFEGLIDAGRPAVELVAGEPRVQFFTDPGGSRIGIRIFSRSGLPEAPLAEISTRAVIVGGNRAVEVSTGNPTLYREFYAFACAVADNVQVTGLSPARAVEKALQSWAALLGVLAMLSIEKQIGLLGELWLLERIASTQGWAAALQSWKGPDAEEHDFSLPGTDIEVKATTSERRAHMIGSLTQLLPRPARPLYILSLQFTRSGMAPGRTLSEAVDSLRAAVLGESPPLGSLLDARLADSGWRQEHSRYYRARWGLRTPASLVTVDMACPQVVPATLAQLGAGRLARILQLSYRVSLDGLGVPDGSPEFLRILP